MKIVIEFIEPNDQRYSTSGDYFVDPDGNWQIKVNKMDDARSMLSVAIHELFEMGQVIQDKIPIEDIDRFDIDYEQKRMPGDNSEPGDDSKAPYFEQHQQATAVELMYCMASGMTWGNHEQIVLRSLV